MAGANNRAGKGGPITAKRVESLAPTALNTRLQARQTAGLRASRVLDHIGARGANKKLQAAATRVGLANLHAGRRTLRVKRKNEATARQQLPANDTK